MKKRVKKRIRAESEIKTLFNSCLKKIGIVFIVFGCVWAGLEITPAEKITAIDQKIVLCDTKPAQIAQEQKKVFNPYLKASRNNPSFRAILEKAQAKWDSEQEKQVAELKTTLIQEKAVLSKAVDPNDVKPTEEIIKPK